MKWAPNGPPQEMWDPKLLKQNISEPQTCGVLLGAFELIRAGGTPVFPFV